MLELVSWTIFFLANKVIRVIDDKLHVNILDFFGIGDKDDKIFLGDAISNIKDNPTEAYIAEIYAIEGAKLNRVYEKIRSGLPFGIISAFRPFKGAFTKDFTDEEQKKLIKAAKSDFLTKDFLRENDGIYRKLCNCKTFNKTFVDKFTTDGYIQVISYWKEEVENDLLPNKEISFLYFKTSQARHSI